MSSACLLLADSRILVTPQKAVRINQCLRNRFTKPVKAAYVGAANADDPAFYELARQSLDDLFSVPCKTLHVKNSANLPEVDVVLLAGGNVSLGWQWLQQTEVLRWLQRCRAQPNSLFIGVSAGAIHLARGCDPEQTQPFIRPYLDWLPMIVAVHEEQQGWPTLALAKQQQPAWPSLSIEFGAGVWFERQPDGHFQLEFCDGI